MDRSKRFDDLVAPLRADVVSGAGVLAKTAAEVLRRAAIRLQAGSLEELRWEIGEVSRRVLEAQPAMASLVILVRDVMEAVESAESLEDGRHAAAAAADDFRQGFETRADYTARHAVGLLPVGGLVGTMSSSSTVLAALLHEAAPPGLRVLCFESRPKNEGRALASSLANAGLEVSYAVDAAAEALVPTCGAIILGADSVGDRGVVNKIGSAAIASAAVRAGVPVYVLADETKILPPGFPQILDDDRPGEEVWESAPGDVRVWNRYFEVVPMEHVTAVVTETGVLDAEGLEAARREMDFPDGLRAWAGRYGRER